MRKYREKDVVNNACISEAKDLEFIASGKGHSIFFFMLYLVANIFGRWEEILYYSHAKLIRRRGMESEADLQPCWTSTMKLFCENS